MARRRVGAGPGRRIAESPNLDAGLALLEGTAFTDVAVPGTALPDAEHRIRAELLWELRVLAGWMPSGGTPLARALAARFEMANIEAHRDRLAGRGELPLFALGALALSWPRLAATGSLDELRGELAASPWGDPGGATATEFHDALHLGWLRMVSSAARMETVRRWAAAGAALVVARRIGVLQQRAREPLVRAAVPLIGWRWASAGSLANLRAALPETARWVLDDIAEASQLWRAETRLRLRMESDGYRMLRAATPGPEPVVGALAVLAVDDWRVRAALASAATGAGPAEVFDVVA
ncbi:MAG: hypothetical protein ACOCUN_01510 [Jiangellaceae bacterium]